LTNGLKSNSTVPAGLTHPPFFSINADGLQKKGATMPVGTAVQRVDADGLQTEQP
jgi:hypothetical protein